jgi:solute:Na+ symporter, SSS family
MNIVLFLTILFGLQAVCLWVGRRASRSVKSGDDYYLAGRNVRVGPLMMTFLATQVGGGLMLGSAQEAYEFGWSVILYPLGASLGLIALGLGLGRRLARFKVATVAQILEVVYGSRLLRQGAGALSVISLFMILVAQMVAASQFLASIGVESVWISIAFWAIVIFYTVQGGLKAVIATDLVQAGFFIVVFVGCLVWALVAGTLPTIGAGTFALPSGKLCGWLLMPLLFMMIEQDMGQRCFAAGSPRAVSRATLWAGCITLLLCAVPILFGMAGRALGLTVAPGASILMAAITATTNPYVAALVGCAILAAIISTADSLINAIGSNLSNDLTAKINVRWVSGLIAIAALASSFFFTRVVDLLILSYELSVSCLAVPVVMALFRRGSLRSALLAIAGGAIGFILLRFIETPLPRELLSVLFSAAGYGLGALQWVRRIA